jgi:SAM-dependent methyltransferase
VKEDPSESLHRLRVDWERLGSADPLWAVYVTKEARHGGWDVDAFLETGRREVEDSWHRLAAATGAPPGGDCIVLDFGCGAGRLASALAERAAHVIGIDISEPMLRTAQEVVPPSLRDRVSLMASSSPGLPLRAASVDIVYTSLVLQHMPSHLALGYVREFMRVLKPGGYALIQIAEQPDSSVKGWAFRVLPPWAYGALQRILLRYPAPMRMEPLQPQAVQDAATQAGGRLITGWEDSSYGGHWSYRRLLLTRDGE